MMQLNDSLSEAMVALEVVRRAARKALDPATAKAVDDHVQRALREVALAGQLIEVTEAEVDRARAARL